MYAGGGEPDAPRDIGEGHALRALGVDRLGRGGENRVALGTKSLRAAFVALGYRLRPLHRARLPASFRRNSSFLHPGEIGALRSEEHTSELQSLMRTSYAVFCLKKKNNVNHTHTTQQST